MGKGFLLLLITIIVYLPALRGGFVWDDNSTLVGNALVKADDGLFRIWFTTQSRDYFPLTYSFLWLQWRLWHMNPLGYHAVNILLHAVSALGLWRALLRLRVPGAWLAALVFAIHPVNVASVAWIAEFKNTLSMVWGIAACLCYFRYEDNLKRSAYWLALGLFLLALLSKTSVVTLPIILLLCTWWRRGRVTKQDIVRTIPFFILSLAMGILTVWFQNQRAIDNAEIPIGGLFSRIATSGFAAWFYFFKAIVPHDLSMLYPRWGPVDASSPQAYFPFMLLAALLGVAFRCRKTWGRPVLFGMGYFTVTLLPVLGFFKMYYFRFSPVADHWQYLSIVGVIALVVSSGVNIVQKANRPVLGIGTALALVTTLGVLTWNRTFILKDTETLWRDVLRRDAHSWTAHMNLADNCLKQGRNKEALAYARGAVELEPTFVESHLNLGVVLAHANQFDEAVAQYREAVKLRPDSYQTHNELGVSLELIGHMDEAIFQYRESLELAPNIPETHVNLGLLLDKKGEMEEACMHYQEALKTNPDLVDAHFGFGMTLAKRGLREEAIFQFQEILRLDPGNSAARSNVDTLRKMQSH